MLVYGKQSVYYVIEHHQKKIETLYLAKDLDKKEYSRLMKLGFEIKRIPENAAQSMSKSGNHQGFLADIEPIARIGISDLKEPEFVVILSALTDVGNIGAIVRSAYALGVDAIIVTGLKSLNFETIARTSSGALFDMPLVVETNIHDVINDLKTQGFSLYGAVLEGEDIRGLHVKGKRALILGSEGEGLSARVVKKLDHKIKISMQHGFDSLNVSAAGAILMDRMRNE
ncbi:MAG: 23S rRNA (guanosine(2251)-2'-O)-methyltransferase RlmB [Campylobacterota bacterium]|nr:23S rRNA (guanosine(2251)-2'-O)-methyltransferase RlmB [Campylobacterota bacterium]